MSIGNYVRWLAVIVLLTVLAGPALAVAWGHLTIVEVDGGSMEPTITYGDVVVIREPTAADLTVGTIVTVEDTTGVRYTHRISSVNPDGTLQLKGDNNAVVDPAPTPPSEVVGVLIAHFSGPAATVVSQLQSWPLRICVLIVVLGLVFYPLAVANTAPSRRKRRSTTPTREASSTRHRSRDVRLSASARASARSASTSETLALVDSMQRAVGAVLADSERPLAGQYTVRTTPGSADFPRIQLLIEVSDKSDTPSVPLRSDIESVRTVVPSSPEASELLWTRAAGSVGPDLPTRRAQRASSSRGRRSAGRRH